MNESKNGIMKWNERIWRQKWTKWRKGIKWMGINEWINEIKSNEMI